MKAASKPREVSKDPTAYQRWELPNVGPATSGAQRLPAGPLTAAQVEAMQVQAYSEAASDGRKSGYEAGFKEGQAAAQAQMEVHLDRIRGMLDYLARPLAAFDDSLEESLLALSMTVAQQLVRRELRTDPGEIVAAVREALAALPAARRDVRLLLHPEDVVLVREALAVDEREPSWRIIEDPLVTRGGCRVEAADSRIDATVENRLATVVAQVLGGEREGDE